MKKRAISLIVILILFLIIIVIYYNSKTEMLELNNSTVSNIDTKIDIDNGDEDIDWSQYQNQEYELSESITITAGGVYNLTGTIEDGYIKINTAADIELVLNGINIKNSQGPAIYIESAENVLITLKENSENYLEDGSTYIGYDEEVNAVIYSKDDITFDGLGSLEINSNYQDGIVGKDDLKIINGSYTIVSQDDAIRGKDSVYILNGNFNITSGGDAIKSTNDIDTEKGFIAIENGSFNIIAQLDGLQAETKIIIYNGNFNIKTGDGSSNSSSNSSNWGHWSNMDTDTNDSAKGLKAVDNLVIENGTFILDTSDDSLHSNNYIGIKNGEFIISSGDDGIHADTEIIIDDGNISIEKAFEGIEAAKITINNGTIDIIASDDGINIAGGTDSSAMNRMGQNNYNQNTDNILTINGGTISINSTGDGIDLNGSGYMYGGTIIIDGPTSSNNAFLDYDGEFVISSGDFIGVGASGMTQGISSSSTQYNILVNFTNTYDSGTNIKIVDETNNIIKEFDSKKSFSSMLISNSNFKKSANYTILINDETYYTLTIENISTTIGNNSRNNGGDMQNRKKL